jgi:hypothetical protein
MKSKIPEGMTETQVLEIIERVSTKLAYKFVFGYHTHDDIKQQAFIEAWKGLDKYDSSRPLENFLWAHIKNRLCNFKRDNFERPDKPCLKCPLAAYNPNCSSGCDLYTDKSECDLYRNWAKRNNPKKNLVNTIDIENIDDEHESNMSVSDKVGDEIDKSHVFDVIDSELPIYLRPYYIKWKAGCKIPKQYRDEIKTTIQKILKTHDITPEETW